MQDIPTKLFAEGLWDKIFVTGTVIPLGLALLGDNDPEVIISMVIFCSAAVRRGHRVLHFLCETFLPKYVQAILARGDRDSYYVRSSMAKFFIAAIRVVQVSLTRGQEGHVTRVSLSQPT